VIDLSERTNPQAQAAESAKHERTFMEWLQSYNLVFYNAMMSLDERFLSKVGACFHHSHFHH
jgi:hypothetical protein